MEEARFKFEKLIIWQKAMDFGEDPIKLLYGFQKMKCITLALK